LVLLSRFNIKYYNVGGYVGGGHVGGGHPTTYAFNSAYNS